MRCHRTHFYGVMLLRALMGSYGCHVRHQAVTPQRMDPGKRRSRPER